MSASRITRRNARRTSGTTLLLAAVATLCLGVSPDYEINSSDPSQGNDLYVWIKTGESVTIPAGPNPYKKKQKNQKPEEQPLESDLDLQDPVIVKTEIVQEETEVTATPEPPRLERTITIHAGEKTGSATVYLTHRYLRGGAGVASEPEPEDPAERTEWKRAVADWLRKVSGLSWKQDPDTKQKIKPADVEDRVRTVFVEVVDSLPDPDWSAEPEREENVTGSNELAPAADEAGPESDEFDAAGNYRIPDSNASGSWTRENGSEVLFEKTGVELYVTKTGIQQRSFTSTVIPSVKVADESVATVKLIKSRPNRVDAIEIKAGAEVASTTATIEYTTVDDATQLQNTHKLLFDIDVLATETDESDSSTDGEEEVGYAPDLGGNGDDGALAALMYVRDGLPAEEQAVLLPANDQAVLLPADPAQATQLGVNATLRRRSQQGVLTSVRREEAAAMAAALPEQPGDAVTTSAPRLGTASMNPGGLGPRAENTTRGGQASPRQPGFTYGADATAYGTRANASVPANPRALAVTPDGAGSGVRNGAPGGAGFQQPRAGSASAGSQTSPASARFGAQ